MSANPSQAHEAAVDMFGREAYDATPKAVFAIVAFVMADLCSPSGVGNGEALKVIADELKVLAANGFIEPAQAKRISNAIKRTIKEESNA